MKDITIKATVIKKELIFFSICFLFASLINVYAIVSRETRWIELISMMHIVFILSALFYGMGWFVRLVVRLFRMKR